MLLFKPENFLASLMISSGIYAFFKSMLVKVLVFFLLLGVSLNCTMIKKNSSVYSSLEICLDLQNKTIYGYSL